MNPKPRNYFFSLTLIFALSISACNMPSGDPTATPTVEPQTVPSTGTGNISGAVWHDLCAIPTGPLPDPLPVGCISNGTGGAKANGVREGNEPGIPEVVVDLHMGDCNAPITASASTDLNGNYSFPNLAGGRYCVSIDLNNQTNQKVLIPGEWTHPLETTSMINIPGEVGNGLALAGMDFGWDYQFLPEVSAPPVESPTPVPPTLGPQGPVFVVDIAANCRSGPGTVYPILTTFPLATTLTLTGRNSDSTWWYAAMNASQFCWISGVTGHTNGNVGGLPVVAAPPTPIQPTGTPALTLTPGSSGNNPNAPVLSGSVVNNTPVYYPTSSCPGSNNFTVAIHVTDTNLSTVWLMYRLVTKAGSAGAWNQLNPNDNASGGLYGFNYELGKQMKAELGEDGGQIQYQFYAKDSDGNQSLYPSGNALNIPLEYCP